MLDDLAPLVQMTDAVEQRRLHLFDPSPAYRLGRGGRYSMGAQPDQPASGAHLFVWVGDTMEGAAEGTLTVKRGGETVREIALALGSELEGDAKRDGVELEAGLNRLVWDLFGERPKTLEGAVMSLGYQGPNQLPPGDYVVGTRTPQQRV